MATAGPAPARPAREAPDRPAAPPPAAGAARRARLRPAALLALLLPTASTAAAPDGPAPVDTPAPPRGDAPAADEVDVTVTRDRGPAPGARVADVDAVARPGDGLEDVLATLPGVQIRRLGGLGAFAGISLRGTGFRQTLLRLDGVPLNPDGVEAVDLSQWPLAGLGSVTVQAGRPAATVGAAPVGGVVDLATRPGAPSSRLELGAGSFASGRLALSAATPLPVPGDLLVAADAFATTGRFRYLDDNGTLYATDDDAWRARDNNTRRQAAAVARLRLGDDALRFTALASAAARAEGLPGPIGAPQNAAGLGTTRGLASLGVDGVVGVGRLTGRVWWLARRERPSDPQDELDRLPAARIDAYDTVGAHLSGEGAVHPVVALRGGLDARWEGFARREGTTVQRTASRVGVGVAVDAPVSTADGRVTVTPGLDARALYSLDAEDDRLIGAVLPGASLRATAAPGVELWASGGGAFRPPDLSELYGDRGTLVGNPDLRPERAWKLDVGARASARGAVAAHAELSAFATFATDTIGWLQNTQRTVIATNFGRTRTLGGELGLSASASARAGLSVSLTLLHARQTTDDPTLRGRPVPFVAPAHAWARLWTAPTRSLQVGVDLDATSAVPVDPQGLTRQPARLLVGAHLAWSSPDGAWSVSFDLDNLTHARTGLVRRDPLGDDPTRVPAPITDFVGYPLPGRTAWIAVRATPGRPPP